MLSVTRIAAEQEVERFRANVATAEILLDLEAGEIAAALESREIAATIESNEIAADIESREIAANLEAREIAANIESREIALQILQNQLESAVVTSPINGNVTAVHAAEGAVGSGLMFVIEDTSALKITTRFREFDIGRIEPGMEVVITSNVAGGAEDAGVIGRINPAAVNGGGPVVEFEAEVIVTSVDTALRIGMGVRLEVVL